MICDNDLKPQPDNQLSCVYKTICTYAQKASGCTECNDIDKCVKCATPLMGPVNEGAICAFLIDGCLSYNLLDSTCIECELTGQTPNIGGSACLPIESCSITTECITHQI